MIKVKGLRKSFTTGRGDVKAVDGISFEVADGEFFTLLGPSGCGKSTILRCIAGLERPEDGEIIIGDTSVFSASQNRFVPPYERDISMVFQSYAIWPHMTVFGNVAYPLQGKMSKAEIHQKVMDALELVQIPELFDRPAPQLSGGQQQRVAVARAIIKGSKVLLLDEPLSNLDTRMRAHMRTELRALQRRLNITTVYVTHDQEEALSLSTRVAIINHGQLVTVDSPQVIYWHPTTAFAAEFFGACNMLPGSIVERGKDSCLIQTPVGELQCSVPVEAKEKVVIGIKPEHVQLVEEKKLSDNLRNVFRGTVTSVLFLGRFSECHIQVGSENLKVEIPPHIDVREGQDIYAYFPPEFCIVLPED